MFDKIIKKINQKGNKIPFSFKVEEKLKNNFQKVCEDNNITMTEAIVSFFEITVEENKKDQ